jgi:ABC-type nitrate/sulfonate/bicarbonate transport system substrate-binding protein
MNRMRALLAVTALAVLAIAAPASAQAASKGGETVTYTTNGYGNRP